MTETLQHVVVTGAAIAAVVWLALDRIRRRRDKKCDGCALAQSLRRDD
ncbi:MAG TPA: hypothetical protein VFT13_12510 [Candidatus Krumholzibacteria bacterium]|nr:hypothetical protein [Candidatus Krumholzibacteria bacterium]